MNFIKQLKILVISNNFFRYVTKPNPILAISLLFLLGASSAVQAEPTGWSIETDVHNPQNSIGQSSDAGLKVIPNSIDLIVSDMQGDHEGPLDGVNPACKWCFHPRLNYGNDPNRGGYSAFQFWGIVYLEAGSTVPENVRIQIRNLRAYYFSKKDLNWHVLQKDTTMNGLHYLDDFSGTPIKADTRVEADGSKSITMMKGYNYHFWPASAKQKIRIDPNDIGGIFTTYQARLIMDNPAGENNLAKAKFLAQSGGDYYLYPPTGRGNPIENDDVGMGKFKYLTKDWQSFNMHSMSEEQIRRTPPPLD
jgi:hypothetical protein